MNPIIKKTKVYKTWSSHYNFYEQKLNFCANHILRLLNLDQVIVIVGLIEIYIAPLKERGAPGNTMKPRASKMVF